jgi:hypothetical protein
MLTSDHRHMLPRLFEVIAHLRKNEDWWGDCGILGGNAGDNVIQDGMMVNLPSDSHEVPTKTLLIQVPSQVTIKQKTRHYGIGLVDICEGINECKDKSPNT